MARNSTSIEQLPDEMLLNILSHFGPEDLCLIIADVCKKWNDLSRDMVLWKTLSYKCDSSPDISRIAKVLTKAPALQLLIIHDREDVADILECLFRNCRLRKPILVCCCFGEDPHGLLQNNVHLYLDLEVLSLIGCIPLTSTFYHLIPWLKKLSELRLSQLQGLSGNALCLIVDSCQHLKKLSLTCVEQFLDDDDDDDDIIHVIKKLGKQLTALALSGTGVTDVAYSYLSNCSRLQELEVISCEGMTDTALLDGIESLHELTSLDISLGYSLTTEGLSRFLNQPSMTSVELLNVIHFYNMDDDGLKGIAKRCIHLKELSLSECGSVTDVGISIVIRHCNQLRVLNLVCLPHITGEGYLALTFATPETIVFEEL